MKSHIEPTKREFFLPDDQLIITKTDTQGRLIYCNPIFIEISGYSEAELLGQQHNIVRHPDMPRGLFHLLWETLKAGGEFNGYLKNLRKDGGFYWVFANITPSYATDGALLGYYSVRRRPEKEALVFLEGLYREMVESEKATRGKKAIAASTAVMNALLSERGVDYDPFIFSL